MKKITLIVQCIAIALISFILYGCGVSDDAAETPIGSVFTGQTRDADEYVEKVRQKNRTTRNDSWNIESNERM